MKTIIFLSFLLFNLALSIGLAQPNYNSNSSGNWSTTTRWTPNGTPVSTSNITISADNITANVSTTVASITVTGSGTLTIPVGVTLTVVGVAPGTNAVYCDNGGQLIIEGTLIIQNGDLEFKNTATIDVSGSLSILNGSLIAKNGFVVDAAGSIYVSGNVTINNGYNISIDGSFTVDGDLTAGGGGGAFVGTGILDVGGTTTIGGTVATTLNQITTRWLGVGTDWATGANWSNGVPGTTTDVSLPTTPTGGSNFPIINGTVTIGSLFMASGATLTVAASNNFTVSQAIANSGTITLSQSAVCTASDTYTGTGALIISPAASFTIAGIFTNNGTLTVQSSAVGTGVFVNNSTLAGAGTYTVQQYLTAGDFHYIASPLSTVAKSVYTLTDWGATNPNFYEYDESIPATDNILLGWKTPTVSNLEVAKGYAVYFTQNKTYSLSGGTPNTGNLSLTVNRSNNGFLSDGWNLVGNPYLTNINADAFITANTATIQGTLYFWEDANSDGIYSSADYAAWNGAGSVGSGGSKTPNGIVGVGQSFFVRKSAVGSGSVSFTNAMRSTAAPVFFKSAQTNLVSSIKFSVQNSNKHYSETLIAFKSDATDGFDDLYDAYKLPGNSDVMLFSKLENLRMSIQTFGIDVFMSEKQILLSLEVKKAGLHTFKVIAVENISDDFSITLEDKLTGLKTDLRQNREISINVDKPQVYTDRFILQIKKKINSIMNTVNTAGDSKNSIKIYGNSQLISVTPGTENANYSVAIYSIDCRLLHIETGLTNFASISVSLKKGIYVAVLKYEFGISEKVKFAITD